MSVSDNIRNQVVQVVRTMPGQECERLEKVILASLPAAKDAFNPIPLVEVICEIKGELKSAPSRTAQRAATRTSHNETAKYRATTWKRRRR